jgi:hypothetical protein
LEEVWKRWEVENDLISKYYIESVTDNIEGLRIVLSDATDESKKVEILFEDSVHVYRSTDESFRQSTINKLDEHYGAEFYRNRTFFIVTNSEYIQWLSLQSYGISDSEPVYHFSILAVDSVVDVIAAYEPKISKLY